MRMRPRVHLYTGKEIPYVVTMIQSRVTSKAQTTIPAPVRKALGLRAGDMVTYRIEAGGVVMTRAAPASADDPFDTFSEWQGPADKDAYAGF